MLAATKKQEIASLLRTYVERFGSQNKASNSLKGISSATVSQVLNNNWDLISDEMWRNIGSQIGFNESDWVAVETRDYKLLTDILQDAQDNSNVFAVTGEAGTGKSLCMREYQSSHKRAYLLQCADYWNRKMFLGELMTAMGRDFSGMNVGEIMHEIVRILKTTDHPLIVLDEGDKLSDQVLYFFITLYNQLEGHCGIVICSTDHLSKRIRRGLKLNKKGYKEIYSRIARKFIELKGPSTSDIMQICMANGITDRGSMQQINDEAEGDLRRVRRKIHALTSTN